MGLTRVAAEQLLLRARRRLSSEYLALDGEPTRMRVMLWPVLAVLPGMRERLARLRQYMAGNAALQLPASLEGASQIVVAAAFGGALLAGGLVLATPTRDAAAQQSVAISHGSDYRAPAPVEAAASTATPRFAATDLMPVRRTMPVARVTPPRAARRLSAGSSGNAQSTAPAEVTRVEVAPRVEQAPIAPKAVATKRRSADRYIVEAHVGSRVGDLAPTGGGYADLNCSSGSKVASTACYTLDAAEEVLPGGSR